MQDDVVQKLRALAIRADENDEIALTDEDKVWRPRQATSYRVCAKNLYGWTA